MANSLAKCCNLDDVRKLAQKRLPEPIYDYIAAGSGQEITLRRNTSAFDDITLVPRVAVDVTKIDTATVVFGKPVSFPLMVAPTGVIGVVHPKVELAIAKAASDAGIMYALSTFSTASLEAVAGAGTGPRLFQLYILPDQGLTDELIQSAKAANYDALCITIDVFAKQSRPRVDRWQLNPGMRPPLHTLLRMMGHPIWMYQQSQLAKSGLIDVNRRATARGIDVSDIYTQFRSDITWKDVERVAQKWNGPIAVKGILRAEDAVKAADAGATAVIVCNHGGLLLDGAPASISVVREIVDAVEDRVEVIQCGGLRQGDGILKALALGAKAVMTGRPFIYGAAAAGEAGVARVIEIFREELKLAMKLTGYASVSELNRTLIL